jgi:NitT/TauT family transport system substrate-binding protein
MTKRPRFTRKVVVWGAVIVVAASSLAGASLASPHRTELTKLTFRTGFGIGGWDAGFFVALNKGYYRQAGLDVTIGGGTGSFSNVQLAAAGRADIVHAASPAMIPAVLQGAKLKMIASFIQVAGSGMATKPEIRTVQDFVGKTFTGGAFDYTAQIFPTYLRTVGVDPSSVHMELKQFGNTTADFLSGRYDGVVALGWAELLELKAHKAKFNYFGFAKAGLNYMGPGLVVNTDWLASNRATARAFAMASARGWQYAETHPAEAAAIVRKYNKSIDAAGATLIQRTFPGYNYTPATKGQPLGRMAASDWTNTVNVLFKAGLIKSTIAISQLYENIIPANSPYKIVRKKA